MLALSPADAPLIKEFIRLLSAKVSMGNIPLKPREIFSLLDKITSATAFLPLMGIIRKYGQMTLQEFAQRFRDVFLFYGPKGHF